ncbi:MAG: zf-HC2 domain-containing protein [Pyrinomonadaceae bacterium]|nr:zf-HC2 domain-containing protein [Pyrinomonadaceae bacterium]
MSCELTEKVSALVDEELDEREAVELRKHIFACEVCQQAEKEFLLLRREIKAYTSTEPAAYGRERLLKQILSSGRVPFWKRSVALPVPALALLLLALLSLGVWTAASRLSDKRVPAEAVREEKRKVAPTAAPESQAGDEIDLARFDHGGRAVIYKVRRENSADVSQ